MAPSTWATAEHGPEHVDLLEIYADADGETHFRKTTVDFQERDFAPPSRPVRVSAEMPTGSSLFLVAPPGWNDDFHPTPRRQLAVLLDGTLTMTASDGETVTAEPGTAILLNDQDCKGHLTQVQGDRAATFLLVALPEAS